MAKQKKSTPVQSSNGVTTLLSNPALTLTSAAVVSRDDDDADLVETLDEPLVYESHTF